MSEEDIGLQALKELRNLHHLLGGLPGDKLDRKILADIKHQEVRIDEREAYSPGGVIAATSPEQRDNLREARHRDKQTYRQERQKRIARARKKAGPYKRNRPPPAPTPDDFRNYATVEDLLKWNLHDIEREIDDE